MFALYGSRGSLLDERVVRASFDYLLKHRTSLCIRAACIVYNNGNIAARTGNLKPNMSELQTVIDAFANVDRDTVSVNGVTYVIKHRTSHQISLFNGNTYLVIGRTEVTLIFAICTSRQASSSLGSVVASLVKRLREKHL